MKTKTKGNDMDKYDKAISELINDGATPEDLRDIWNNAGPCETGVAVLFQTLDGEVWGRYEYPRSSCGCLTQAKYNQPWWGAPNGWMHDDNNPLRELVDEIQDDPRIPNPMDCVEEILIEHLPIFAEYQRKADAIKEEWLADRRGTEEEEG